MLKKIKKNDFDFTLQNSCVGSDLNSVNQIQNQIIYCISLKFLWILNLLFLIQTFRLQKYLNSFQLFYSYITIQQIGLDFYLPEN